MKEKGMPAYKQPTAKGQTSGKVRRDRETTKGAGRPETSPKKMGL